MHSALGTVSGSKAALPTVHAKLEALVLRARRHQGGRCSTANARAGAAFLRNAAAVALDLDTLAGRRREAMGASAVLTAVPSRVGW
jgi:hypothetical protein